MRLKNPVLMKELREWMRGKRPFAIITFYLLLLTGVFFLAWPRDFGHYPEANMGRQIFMAVLGVLMVAVVFITPAIASGAIALEKERRTLDLLQVTLLGPSEIILGKLVSSVMYLLLIVLASLPFVSIGFIVGGVSPSEIAKALLLLISVMLGLSALGVFVSLIFKRIYVANGVTYGIVVILTFGTVILDEVLRTTFYQQVPGVYLEWPYQMLLSRHLNPFFAMTTMFQSIPPGEFSRLFWLFGTKVPPWATLSLIYAGTAVVLIAVSIRYFDSLVKRGE